MSIVTVFMKNVCDSVNDLVIQSNNTRECLQIRQDLQAFSFANDP